MSHNPRFGSGGRSGGGQRPERPAPKSAARPGARGGLPPTLKRLGQHFLTDTRILARIADSLELTGNETVVEIGPGRGALTEMLRKRAGRIVAVELDRALAAMLTTRYAADDLVTIVERDVLECDLGEIAGGGPFVLAGNVPYYITTPILFQALQPPRPERAVYLVQREVAERVVADAGTKAYGALTVNVQAVAAAELLFRVPPGAFTPAPRVESAVIRIVPLAQPVIAPEEEAPFRIFVQQSFGLRRKQLRRVVRTVGALSVDAAESALSTAGVDPDARPETLDPAAFARLFRAVRSAGRDHQAPGAGASTATDDSTAPGS